MKYFITVNKYRFCISVIGHTNRQIIGIGISYKKSISVDHYLSCSFCLPLAHADEVLFFYNNVRHRTVSPRRFKKATCKAPEKRCIEDKSCFKHKGCSQQMVISFS